MWGYDLYVASVLPDGKEARVRHRIFQFETRAAAEEAVRGLLSKARDSDHSPRKEHIPPPLRDLIKERLKQLHGAEYTRARRVLDVWLRLLPAQITVNLIESSHIRQFIAHREGEGQKASSINREINIIAATLHQAREIYPGLRNWYPPRIPRPKVHHSRRERIITEEEYSRIIAHLTRPPDAQDGSRKNYRENAYRARLRVAHIFQFAMLTACRHSEIVKLEWRNIDTERNKILIYQGKTRRYKEIPLTPSVAAILDSRRGQSEKFVFTEGGNIYPKFYRILREACEHLGIPYGKNTEGGLVLHAARHTVTTKLVEAGLDFDTIGLVTGHRSKELIAHYAHRTPASVARAAEALEHIGQSLNRQEIGKKKKSRK